MLFAPVYAKPHPRRTLVSSSRLTPVFPLPAPDSPATKSLAYLDIFLLPCSVFSKSFPCHTSETPRDSLATFRRSTFQPFLDLSLFFSRPCELFCILERLNPFVFKQFRTLYRKTPGGGVPTALQSANFRRSSAPHPSHCSRTPLVQQFAKARKFFMIRGNNSAPLGV